MFFSPKTPPTGSQTSFKQPADRSGHFQYPSPSKESWSFHHLLVGGFNPFEKYARQNGDLPQVGVKIKNVWNHHLALILLPNVVRHSRHIMTCIRFAKNEEVQVLVLGQSLVELLQKRRKVNKKPESPNSCDFWNLPWETWNQNQFCSIEEGPSKKIDQVLASFSQLTINSRISPAWSCTCCWQLHLHHGPVASQLKIL